MVDLVVLMAGLEILEVFASLSKYMILSSLVKVNPVILTELQQCPGVAL